MRPDSGDVAMPGTSLRGELLPGWHEERVVLERRRLRPLRMHALAALAGERIGAGRFAEAVGAAHAAVREERSGRARTGPSSGPPGGG